MQLKEKTTDKLPNFVHLKQQYDDLPKGAQADLRRVRTPDNIADLPAYYRWLGSIPPSANMQRIAYLMPFVVQNPETQSLGRQLAASNISEMRMFQMLRSEAPRDLENLRRLIIQAKPKLDWREFGKTLYYWGPTSKRRILHNFFTPAK